MTGNRVSPALTGSLGLLERAIGYTLGSLLLVTDEAMTRPSPCTDWNLGTLLGHLNDSLGAMHEAVDLGRVELCPADYGEPTKDPVAVLRRRACSMLGSWTNAADQGRDHDRRNWVSVGWSSVEADVVMATGALEITVHGWDVAHACGQPRPIPVSLAGELLPVATALVSEEDRPSRFAAAVTVPPFTEPGNRLLAFLGRTPG